LVVLLFVLFVVFFFVLFVVLLFEKCWHFIM
jgi:hypothetical protein